MFIDFTEREWGMGNRYVNVREEEHRTFASHPQPDQDQTRKQPRYVP